MVLGICERLFLNIKVTVQCCVVQMVLGICERLFFIKVTVKCCVVQMVLGICERLFCKCQGILLSVVLYKWAWVSVNIFL